MRIDVVDDARGADHVIALAFTAERMLVQESSAFRLPALRAIERTCDRITLALVVTVALTFVAPADWVMDRWTDRQGDDVDGAEPEAKAPARIISIASA
jgi:hypothetical protein